MKMILFRPTFLTAGMMLQAIALLCIFLSMPSVSAVPQFGRPLFHALDDVPTPSRFVEPLVPESSSSSKPTAALNAAPTTESTSPGDQANAPSPAQSSGASHNLGGVHAALVLSAAASAVFLVF